MAVTRLLHAEVALRTGTGAVGRSITSKMAILPPVITTLGGLPVDGQGGQGLLEDPVQVPHVALHVLVVPGQLAGVGVEGHGRVGVEGVVAGRLLPRVRRQQVPARVGVADAEEQQVAHRVVAARGPDPRRRSAGSTGAVPAVAAAWAGAG